MYGYQDITSNFPIDLDIDVRQSVHQTLYGSKSETAKGRWIVLQRLKRDTEGNPVKSPAAYKLTGEGKNSDRGAATTRTGYLCDELWIRAFVVPSGRLALDEVQSPVGNLGTNRIVFITSAFDVIRQHDVLIVPLTDIEGKVVSPVQIFQEYIATVSYDKRLDGARTEYFMTVAEIQK